MKLPAQHLAESSRAFWPPFESISKTDEPVAGSCRMLSNEQYALLKMPGCTQPQRHSHVKYEPVVKNPWVSGKGLQYAQSADGPYEPSCKCVRLHRNRTAFSIARQQPSKLHALGTSGSLPAHKLFSGSTVASDTPGPH